VRRICAGHRPADADVNGGPCGGCSACHHPGQSGRRPEIIVTGIRASVERAISIKRNAPNVVDAISAQDIGKLPDATISDSLQRIPGVQIRRDAGEGSTVNVRGLPRWSR
jgi:outer membrane receptor for ferrienterochelin and colicin